MKDISNTGGLNDLRTTAVHELMHLVNEERAIMPEAAAHEFEDADSIVDGCESLQQDIPTRGLTRRKLLGLPMVDQQNQTAETNNAKKRRVYGVVAVAAGAVTIATLLAQGGSEHSMAPEIVSLQSISTPNSTSIPTTSMAKAVIVIEGPVTTNKAPITTTTIVAPESTVPIGNMQPIPSTTEILPESVYDSLDCSGDTISIQSGMTFSGIASKCGLSFNNLKALNPGVNTDRIVTGKTLKIRAGAVSEVPVNCNAIGGIDTAIPKDFTVIKHLLSLGLTNEQANNLIFNKGLLTKFGLSKVLAGSTECLPTRETIRSVYGI